MSLDTYRQIVANSHASFQPSGFSGDFDLPSAMFPHQRASVEFALRGGSNALFLDTGLGKTLCALAWGQEVVQRTNRPVLMLARAAGDLVSRMVAAEARPSPQRSMTGTP